MEKDFSKIVGPPHHFGDCRGGGSIRSRTKKQTNSFEHKFDGHG